MYYPESWTDSASGTHYEKGYYDENGQYYDSVSFRKNGRYENVVCHCPYCDSDSVLNLNSAAGSTLELQCPNCGAPMEIRSELDEIMARADNAAGTYAGRTRTRKKKNTLRGILIALLLLLGIGWSYGRYEERHPAEPYPAILQPNVTQRENAPVYLRKTGSNAYRESSGTADKELIWDADADSYYDAATDCWLWYNTDVRPALWQYWYEGISSDYGDFGWMEHSADGWFIEASQGNWIPLPDRYGPDTLWYIED